MVMRTSLRSDPHNNLTAYNVKVHSFKWKREALTKLPSYNFTGGPWDGKR
jgi:hypothetical protein